MGTSLSSTPPGPSPKPPPHGAPRRAIAQIRRRLTLPVFAGDSSVRDEGGDESQLLVQGRGQPHGFHQDQDQRSRRGPVHHPPSGGGGHLGWVHLHGPSPAPEYRTPHRPPSVVSGWPFTPSSAAPGIYSSTEMLDFGTLRSQGTDSHLQQPKEAPVHLQHKSLLFCRADRPKMLNLHLLNSGTKDVPITVGVFAGVCFEKKGHK